MQTPERLPLALLPTPLEPAHRLADAWGGPTIWIKRDDLTGFGVSGNKVRKLELHASAAVTAGATTLVTCGAVQSNHCRATAVVAARLGLRCLLFLRSADGAPPDRVTGNHLLQRLCGADVRFITPDEYRFRDEVMAAAATEIEAGGGRAWVIAEGASDRLGSIAFESAFSELAAQVDRQVGSPVTVWHAASSGGTTAGLALGAAARAAGAAAITVLGCSVGDPADDLKARVLGLVSEVDPSRAVAGAADLEVIDRYVGEGYGRTTEAELRSQVDATRLTGLVWDPTYTGKALHGLRCEVEAGRFGAGDHVVFWHTGGGFAAFAHDYGRVLDL